MATARDPAARRARIALRVVLVLASLVTFLAASLVVAAHRNDRAITGSMGEANAEVVSVGWDRTIVRYQTPDGVIRLPRNGVLYPDGLVEGMLVRVQYATGDPELVRVAGRSAVLTLLPAGTTVLFTWLAAGPLVWWLRRRAAAGAVPAR